MFERFKVFAFNAGVAWHTFLPLYLCSKIIKLVVLLIPEKAGYLGVFVPGLGWVLFVLGAMALFSRINESFTTKEGFGENYTELYGDRQTEVEAASEEESTAISYSLAVGATILLGYYVTF